MRRGVGLAGVLLALVAASLASGRGASSGLAGRVVAGPTCPVERVPPQPDCAPRPLSAVLHIRRAGSRRRWTTVHSRRNGHFHVALPAGLYSVRAQALRGSPLPRPPAPIRVSVLPQRFAFITVTYNTGLR